MHLECLKTSDDAYNANKTKTYVESFITRMTYIYLISVIGTIIMVISIWRHGCALFIYIQRIVMLDADNILSCGAFPVASRWYMARYQFSISHELLWLWLISSSFWFTNRNTVWRYAIALLLRCGARLDVQIVSSTNVERVTGMFVCLLFKCRFDIG